MYAIGKLIYQTIDRDKQKKQEVVEKLGYKNISKGLRRLDDLIKSGSCHKEIHDRLPFALGVDAVLVKDAFEETKKQLQAEREECERKHFYPHIWIVHEQTRPNSITIVGLTGIHNWKEIKLPKNINQKEWSVQEEIVRKNIKESKPKLIYHGSMFGKVTEYIYRQTYEDSILFSAEGEVINMKYGKVNKPLCWVGLR